MRSSSLLILSAAFVFAAGAVAAEPELKYAVIVSRHGVRSPTWDNARLNEYSAQPWPEWGVAPGELTPRGYQLIRLLGNFYGSWLRKQGLLVARGCADADRVHIHADSEQRTMETARAYSESLVPGCRIPFDSLKQGDKDPLFDPISAGLSAVDPVEAAAAMRERLGDADVLLNRERGLFETLQTVLTGPAQPVHPLLEPEARIEVKTSAKSADLTGPLSLASTLTENLLLEYTTGFADEKLGWGRLDQVKLSRILELHGTYAGLTRETPYLAEKRGWNLLSHVVESIRQAMEKRSEAGALGRAGDKVLLIAGHDTNISNLAGMLGINWEAGGYQRNETPPGGALVFLLYGDSSGAYRVQLRFIAQTLTQMRNAVTLDSSHPPAIADVRIPGCGRSGCDWKQFESIARSTIENGRSR